MTVWTHTRLDPAIVRITGGAPAPTATLITMSPLGLVASGPMLNEHVSEAFGSSVYGNATLHWMFTGTLPPITPVIPLICAGQLALLFCTMNCPFTANPLSADVSVRTIQLARSVTPHPPVNGTHVPGGTGE